MGSRNLPQVSVGVGIHRSTSLSQRGGTGSIHAGEEAHRSKNMVLSIWGLSRPPPDDPFPLPTQGQPPHWLTPPQAKPVLATATDNQQGSWLALAIPFLFHLVGEWTLLAESYGEEKLIPPTSGTD